MISSGLMLQQQFFNSGFQVYMSEKILYAIIGSYDFYKKNK